MHGQRGRARAPRAARAPLGTHPTRYLPLGTQLRHSGGRYLAGYIPTGLGTYGGRYLGGVGCLEG